MNQEKLDLTRLFALAEILQHTEFREWCGSVRACAERIAALGDGWQDIATLPDTPDLIMAWGPHHKIPNGAHMIWAGNLLKAHLSPDRPRPSHLQYLATHWRPLPPPPGAKP